MKNQDVASTDSEDLSDMSGLSHVFSQSTASHQSLSSSVVCFELFVDKILQPAPGFLHSASSLWNVAMLLV